MSDPSLNSLVLLVNIIVVHLSRQHLEIFRSLYINMPMGAFRAESWNVRTSLWLTQRDNTDSRVPIARSRPDRKCDRVRCSLSSTTLQSFEISSPRLDCCVYEAQAMTCVRWAGRIPSIYSVYDCQPTKKSRIKVMLRRHPSLRHHRRQRCLRLRQRCPTAMSALLTVSE